MEIFLLVIVAGVGVLFLLETRNGETEKSEAPVKEELLIEEGVLIDIQTEVLQEEQAEVKPEESSRYDGRYGVELADEEYCLQNRIYGKETASDKEVVLAFGGDISFAEGYSNIIALRQRDGKVEKCFDEVMLQEMQNADIFMLNNEFPYTNRGTPTEEKTFTFRANPESVGYLADMGVDIVSVANNHVYDYGEVSLLDTLTTLENAGMPYVGAGRNLSDAIKPVYFVANDIKIAYVSATQIEQGDNPDTVGAGENSAGVFRCWNFKRICEVVNEAKQNADFVVAYVHWGTESTEELHWAQRDLAFELVKAGADIIVGDHPHCLQKITYIDGVPVIYSMGNFWFNSKTQDTGLLKVCINEGGLQSLQFIPAIQSNCKTSAALGSEGQRILDYLQTLSPDVLIDGEGYIERR